MMKRVIGIVPCILLLMIGPAAADTVVVPADQDSWTDTGIDIDRYTKAAISATGLACFDTTDNCQNGEAWTDPDGAVEIADETFLAPGLEKYALVGRIGDGDPFLAGSSFNPLCDEQEGRLYLAFNDSDFSNNSGSYDAVTGWIACDYLCAGSTTLSTHPASPIHGPSDLGLHLFYLLLPVGAVIARGLRRRTR
jgi:hypothetical protein